MLSGSISNLEISQQALMFKLFLYKETQDI